MEPWGVHCALECECGIIGVWSCAVRVTGNSEWRLNCEEQQAWFCVVCVLRERNSGGRKGEGKG